MIGSALSSVLRRAPSSGRLSGGKLQLEDQVEVFSKSLGGWVKDGQVMRIAGEAINTQWEYIPAGSVEVQYGENKYTKWVLEDDLPKMVRKKRTSGFNMPVLLGRGASLARSGSKEVSRVYGAGPEPSAGWDTLIVEQAEAQGSRPTMEDAYVHVPSFGGVGSCYFTAVYDGHGGRAVADFVKEELHGKLLEELNKVNSNSPKKIKDARDTRDAFRRAFKATDQALADEGLGHQCGATACCCLIRIESVGPVVYTAHVGDTRAVLCRSGTARRLTSMTDHKPTHPEELQRIESVGVSVMHKRVNGVLAVARALGDHNLKEPYFRANAISNTPDVTMERLSYQDEFIVVACDGLWDVMSDQEAVDLVRLVLARTRKQGMKRREGVQVAAQTLIREALDRRTSDNVTCSILVPGIVSV